MKRKGFTLIELLAVIVVLAIIALIATPIVMNVIKNASKGAAERSVERYLDAVETAIATDRLENGLIADDTYTIKEDGNLYSGDTKVLTVDVSGDKPEAGSKVVIEKGQVVSRGTSMTIGDYTVTIDSTGKATATLKAEPLVLCRATTPTEQQFFKAAEWTFETAVVGVQATSEAPYALGAEYTCDLGDGARTFYVLKEDGDNVKLIMNENIGDTVSWCVSGNDNSCAADGAKAALTDRTSGWTTLTSAGGTVELPSGQDIAEAMGDTSWNNSAENMISVPNWMLVNLDPFNEPFAYWTSTPFSNEEDSTRAYAVLAEIGSMYPDGLNTTGHGIRPVITISKSNMSL